MADIEFANKKFQKELNSGTSALVLLSVLGRAAEPMYGYQIVKHIENTNTDIPMMKHGALYPVLRSLESSGLLESRVEPSTSGPPRRYYSITDTGRDALGRWIGMWRQTKRFVDTVLGGDKHE
ncbi:MAG: PadR family transcriptional regulator [Candidatus Latescibacterota bacterium]|nr:MAG: PadR family transcriptional regulator [Candidatus Latescibacterota bacterium]